MREIRYPILGAYLKDIRVSAGLSIRELVQRMTGSWVASNMNEYEHGRHAPTVKYLVRLAKAYGFNREYTYKFICGAIDALTEDIENEERMKANDSSRY